MQDDKKFDGIQTPQLIEMAYNESSDDCYWEIIFELSRRGSDVEFEAALKLIDSQDSLNREIGAQVLSRLDGGKHTYHVRAVDALIPLLYDDNDDVIEAAAFGLGHRNDIKSVRHLLKLINHDHSGIRHGAALGLSCIDEEDAAHGLIKLSSDQDFDTRNWATFGLAQQCDLDSPEIRQALEMRLKDSEAEIRGEALIGLAMRNDIEVRSAIMEELKGEFFGAWAVNAAEITGSSEFLDILIEIKKVQDGEVPGHMLSQIEDAIQSCSSRA